MDTKISNEYRNSIFLIAFAGIVAMYAPESVSAKLSIAFPLILLIVTIVYVSHTGKMLEEMQKSRQSVFLEKRLEKFYLPLEHGLDSLSPDELMKFWPYEYLSISDETTSKVDFYILMQMASKSSSIKIDGNILKKTQAELKVVLLDDIRVIKKDLKNLNE